MHSRTALLTIGCIALGALSLALIAPWINPCVGPLRFVRCIDIGTLSTPKLVSPWLACRFEICDFFPSPLERALRTTVVLIVLVGIGFLCGRLVSSFRWLFGAAAGVVTAVFAVVITLNLYDRGAV